MLPDGKRMTIYSLIRFNVTKSNDNSTVICETKNDAFTARASMLLVVKYAPVVTISTEPKNIFEGDKVTFTCTADSNPVAKSFLWFVNGVPNMGSHTNTFVIDKVTRDHHNIKIKCQVRNLEGKVGDKVKKPNVKYKPVFTETPTDVSDDKDQKVELKCKADGNPKPTYIWYRNGDLYQVVGDKSKLTVTVKKKNVGKYYCRVSVTGRDIYSA